MKFRSIITILILLSSINFYAQSSTPQYINIPDIEFEKYLISYEYDSGEPDGKVLASAIKNIPSIEFSSDRSSKITSLVGIEGFTALEELIFNGSKIVSLDLSKNKKLIFIEIQNNSKLTSLNVTGCTNITFLNASESLLTGIDLTTNTKLQTLNLNGNKITQINLTKNTSLKSLEMNYNNLQSIDISKNTKLERIHLNVNELTTFSITNQPVWSVNVSHNKLTTLNASTTRRTTMLNCSYNNLTSLDLSQSTNLTDLLVMGNPNLFCIKTGPNVIIPRTVKDPQTTLNTTCTIQEPEPFTLPANNFEVIAKGENCLNAKNGSIEISAKAQHTYAIKINDKNYTFTNNKVVVPNLEPGNYEITITVNGNYEQKFTANIQRGLTVSGTAKLTNRNITANINQGTAPYTIYLDGIKQFSTSSKEFDFDSKGASLVEIETSKICEGTVKELLTYDSTHISAYPNPTFGALELNIPTTLKKEVPIGLYAIDGQLISRKTYPVIDHKIQLSVDDQPNGIYIIEAFLEAPKKLKILKK